MSEATRVHLYLLTGPHAGDEFRVQGAAVLGRLESNEVRLDDKKASRRHARVFQEGGAVFLQDLGSSNGTFLGEERITRVELKDGDVFQVGATKVRVRLERPGGGGKALQGVRPSSQGGQEPPQVELRRAPSQRDPQAQVEVKSGGSGRLLQFHKIEDKGGIFSEDLSQRGGLFKLILFLVLSILGALLFYFAFQMGSGGK